MNVVPARLSSGVNHIWIARLPTARAASFTASELSARGNVARNKNLPASATIIA